jgi:hypothetical protein
MKPERIPMIHRMKFTSQEVIEQVQNPKEYPIKISRPVSIGNDVQSGDKLIFEPQGVVRSISQVTDMFLFLKR